MLCFQSAYEVKGECSNQNQWPCNLVLSIAQPHIGETFNPAFISTTDLDTLHHTLTQLDWKRIVTSFSYSLMNNCCHGMFDLLFNILHKLNYRLLAFMHNLSAVTWWVNENCCIKGSVHQKHTKNVPLVVFSYAGFLFVVCKASQPKFS